MEKTENCKISTVESTLLENRKLINECVEVANFISVQLSNDGYPNDPEPQITCIMDDLLSQNQDLNLLLNIMLKIKNHLTGGVE